MRECEREERGYLGVLILERPHFLISKEVMEHHTQVLVNEAVPVHAKKGFIRERGKRWREERREALDAWNDTCEREREGREREGRERYSSGSPSVSHDRRGCDSYVVINS